MVIQGAPATCESVLDFSTPMPYTSLMNENPTHPNPWHPEDPAKWSPVSKTWVFTKKFEIPKDLQKLMWAGKLNQRCTYCDHVEPAGGWCHSCLRQLSPDTYFQSRSLDENGKPRRGRPRRVEANGNA